MGRRCVGRDAQARRGPGDRQRAVCVAGFAIVGTFAPGVYNLVIYARSSIAGAFNNWRTVRIIGTN